MKKQKYVKGVKVPPKPPIHRAAISNAGTSPHADIRLKVDKRSLDEIKKQYTGLVEPEKD